MDPDLFEILVRNRRVQQGWGGGFQSMVSDRIAATHVHGSFTKESADEVLGNPSALIDGARRVVYRSLLQAQHRWTHHGHKHPVPRQAMGYSG